jgi:hypothetical protein
MKKKFVLLLSVFMAVIFMMKPTANAISLNIDIGDHGFYEGVPSYWDGGYQYFWVPGHREHGHWVHGFYERRGEFRREHEREHHERHHRDGDRH